MHIFSFSYTNLWALFWDAVIWKQFDSFESCFFKLLLVVGVFSLELTFSYYRDNFWLLYPISQELWDLSFCLVRTETAPSPMWALSIVPSNSSDWFFHWPWVFSVILLCWIILSWRLQKPLKFSGDLSHRSSPVSNTLPPQLPASPPHLGELPGYALITPHCWGNHRTHFVFHLCFLLPDI